MVEIFKQKQTGIEIKTIEEDIDYRTILMILTPNGFSYENSMEFYQGVLKELNDFLQKLLRKVKKTDRSGKTYQPKTL